MALSYDDIWLKEADLLVPGKKPFGPVKVDWSNQITRDFTGCFLFQTPHIYRNHVEHMPDMVSESDAPAQPSTRGNNLLVDGSSYDLKISNELLNGSTNFDGSDWTFIVKIDTRTGAVATNDQYILQSTPRSPDISTPIYYDNLGTIGRFTSWASPGKVAITSPEQNITPYVFSTLANAHDSVANTSQLFLNGGVLSGGAQTSAFVVTYAEAFFESAIWFLTTRLTGEVEFLYVFSRPLSAEEIASIYSNPYQVIVPDY